MTLTKMIIAETISKQTGRSKKESHHILETLIEIMKRNLENGNDILIPRFGKFYLIDKQARLGRNPNTGERLVIQPLRRVMFKHSRKLKNLLNANDLGTQRVSRIGKNATRPLRTEDSRE